jgi:hypothetical protein
MPQDPEISEAPAESRAASDPSGSPLPDDSARRARRLDAAAALAMLQSRRCPACEFACERERKFFLWFALESYLEAGTKARLDGALGMCPRHCRTLIRRSIYPGTLISIYDHVVGAALGRLRGEGEKAECIGCEHERWATGHAIDTVVRALSDPEAAQVWHESRGFCAPHLLEALARGTRESAGPAVAALEAALSETPVVAPEIFAGNDWDAELRAAFLHRLPEDLLDAKSVTTAERLRAILRVDACPACLSAGQAERRYLAWIGEERGKNSPHFAPEVIGLCATHLADLRRLDPDAASWIAFHKRSLWGEVLVSFRARRLSGPDGIFERFRARRASLRSDRDRSEPSIATLLEVVGEVLAPQRHWKKDVRALAMQLPGCGACRAERTAGERTIALLLAALENVPLLRSYLDSHGLCVRHVLSLREADRSLPADTVCRARLEWIAWELAEASRKLDWTVRYEKRGEEFDAWRRAMGMIDGRVFLGGEPSRITESVSSS